MNAEGTHRVLGMRPEIGRFGFVLLGLSLAMLKVGGNTAWLGAASFAGLWLCLGGWLAIAPTATATSFGMAHDPRHDGTVFFAYGLGAILGGIISGHAKDMFGSSTDALFPRRGSPRSASWWLSSA